MANVRSLLTRAASSFATRVTPKSPVESVYGSLEAFADKVNADIGAGKLDKVEGPMLLQAVLKWHRDWAFGQWTRYRNQAWEYGGR